MRREEIIKELELFCKKERLIEQKHSIKGINRLTSFDQKNPLFFGIGGGNHQRLSKGLPFDVLSMILIGQKLKQSFKLGPCYVFLADQTTCINGFTKEAVNKLMTGQKELLEITLKGLGIERDWKVFLETNLGNILGSEAEKSYQQLIANANQIPFMGGSYYCRETAATLTLAEDGIKIGWSGNGLRNDERMFDQATMFYTEQKQIPHKVSYLYVPPGIRICSKIVERVPPYLLLEPEKRICLSSLEAPVAKIEKGNGLWSKLSRRMFGGIVQLFEELVYNQKIPASENSEFRGQVTAEKMAFILQYIFNGYETEVEKIWKSSFKAL